MRNVIKGSDEIICTKGPLASAYLYPEEEPCQHSELDTFLSYYSKNPNMIKWLDYVKRNEKPYVKIEEPLYDNCYEVLRNMGNDKKRYEIARKCILENGYDLETNSFNFDVFDEKEASEINKIRVFIDSEGLKWKDFYIGDNRILVLYERRETEIELFSIGLDAYDYIAAYLYSSAKIYSKKDLGKEAERLQKKEQNWKLADGYIDNCGKKTTLNLYSEDFWKYLLALDGGD